MFCLTVHVTLYDAARRHGAATRMTKMKSRLQTPGCHYSASRLHAAATVRAASVCSCPPLPLHGYVMVESRSPHTAVGPVPTVPPTGLPAKRDHGQCVNVFGETWA